ncbi:hypothetical protein E4U42_006611 [Claviceps africana]|uniref:Cytidyltransferase-like domain-containing protein n=1 Tax=Claviceps africana TaxID=83212 RepID=A0A8K0J244_9HYPO|nr:hypothetical protein E4U42_006611 [Claviceps africana]
MPPLTSTDAPSLLLLPSPPKPATAETVGLAYRKPIDTVISRLSNEHKSHPSGHGGPVLVIAVVCPILKPDRDNRRLVCWHQAQVLLAQIYSLVAAVCAERCIATDVEADDAGAVDSRVVLVDDSRTAESSYKPNDQGGHEPNNTAVLDLAAFASHPYPWSQVFHSSCEQGYALLASFLSYSRQTLHHKQLVAVEGGLSFSQPVSAPAPDECSGDSQGDACAGYSTVCLGGTFDHLHPGHKLFLHAAALLLDAREAGAKTGPRCQLVIGISGDELLAKKKHAEELQSWHHRARSVLNFLSTLLSTSAAAAAVQTEAVQAETKELHALYRNGSILVRCVDLRDVYGPTVSEEAIEALVVSGETRGGADLVNQKRRSQGWSALDVYEIDVLAARVDAAHGDQKQEALSNFADKISSTEIRRQKAEGRKTAL